MGLMPRVLGAGRPCGPHRIGVLPGTGPFFYETCPMCRDKLARGLVRGDEGPVANKYGRRIGHRAPKRPRVILPYPMYG
jgi:hypothetical protein